MSYMGNSDLGPSGGDYAGFVSWSSQGSDDGIITRRSFAVHWKEGDTKHKAVWRAAQAGFAWDIRRLKKGWELNVQGAKPERTLVPMAAPFPPRPGDDWKRAFSVPVSAGDGNTFLWEQGGATAFACLQDVAPVLEAQEPQFPGCVPVLRVVGVIDMNIGGKLLGAPKLEVVQWLPAAQVFPEYTPPSVQPALGSGPNYANQPTGQGAATAPAAAPVQQSALIAHHPAGGGFGESSTQPGAATQSPAGGGFGGASAQPATAPTQSGFGGAPAQPAAQTFPTTPGGPVSGPGEF